MVVARLHKERCTPNKGKSTSKEQDTMTQTTDTQRTIDQASDKTAIRPFHVNVPETELTELRRRINATKWPERETLQNWLKSIAFWLESA